MAARETRGMEREAAQIRRNAAIIHEYKSGDATRVLAEAHGLSQNMVRYILRAAHVQLRPSGGPISHDPRPRCARCGIILEESGLEHHPAQWHGNTCWLCQAELKEARA